MRKNLRAFIALLLCDLLIFLPAVQARAAQPAAEQGPPADLNPLWKDLQKSYVQIFRLAPTEHFTEDQFRQLHDFLDHSRDHCVNYYKHRADQYSNQRKEIQDQLHHTTNEINDVQRHNLHCSIQNLRTQESQTKVLVDHGIPVAYDNKEAKLELIEKWPAEYRNIEQALADGSYKNRRWGDVKDIGFRVIAAGQADDIKTGEDAVKQMKSTGLLPKAVEDKAVVDYVNSVAQRVAAHSDLQVPLHVTVLNSKEINAFALPGGYLFIERGLLEAADDESELAGVIGHEIGHVTARHGHKLMTRATIASIFYQAAEVAAVVLTGGAASIGVYYALQYGFYGLGLVLDLKLLGVSREYELQADQLGIQYTWNAGYDPSGFIRFFDKMATTEGYVNGVSWFRDHPPFYERMVDAEREIDFLHKKKDMVVQTSAFLKMKQALKAVTTKAEKEAKNQPTLLAPEKGCPVPKSIEYQPGKPIEDICPGTATAPTQPNQ